ncbi:MAG: hypothetical protein P1V51_21050 [Deltaproteobacteria bacterium]|nr:hypothetical protein [Deltaproteobacteria bacterium]
MSEARAIGESMGDDSVALDDDDNDTDLEDDDDEVERPERSASRAPALRVEGEEEEEELSPEAEARLVAIKRAAARIRRVKKAAVDVSRTYRLGQRVFDPAAQSFGRVVFAAEGYVRLELSDGSESAHGKPPLEDRRAFVSANFERMDNKTMADILDISVHTMRRLCHEYGLKRHGKSKASA